MTEWKEFESKPTEWLIDTFQQVGSQINDADRSKAFIALGHRFREDLLEKCEVSCKRFGHSESVAEIIAENTFRAYAKKGNFKKENGRGSTIDESFKIYLYGIAKNELTNYYRLEEKKARGHFYDGSERIITELPQIDLNTLSKPDRIKYEIIQSLPASHRTVYLTYKVHEKLGCNLPKKLRIELREHLGNVKQNTIRGYKKEANDKIAQGLKIMNLATNSEL